MLVAIHLLKWFYWLHGISFRSPYPLTNVDYIQFYGRALRIHEFLQRSGRIWGYDPFDMAGYLSGPFLEVGSHFLALVGHVLEPLVPIASTTLFLELTGLIGAPFLIVAAMRVIGATRNQAWSAFGVGVVMLGTLEAFSNQSYKVGLWGWMTASFIAPAQVALFWRWTQGPALKTWAGFTAVTLLIYQIHPSISVVLLVPNTAIYFLYLRRIPVRHHLALAGAAALTIAANWYWMTAFIAFRQWRVTAPYYDTAGLEDILLRFSPVQKDFYASVRAAAHLFVAFLAFRGWQGLRRRQWELSLVLALWVAWLALVCYFGSSIPGLKTVQPGRNEFPMWIVLYLLAGLSLEEDLWQHPRRKAVALAISFFAALYATPYSPGESPWPKLAPPLNTQLMPWQTEVIRDLSAKRPKDMRVLLECNDDLNPNFADIVSRETGAILIGGQHPGNFLRARSTIFTGLYVVFQGERSEEAVAFGHPLRTMGTRLLAQYLDLYNVGWVYASTRSAIQALDDMPELFMQMESRPGLKAYSVRRLPSWFVEGSGEVVFDYDRIVISDASKGRIVLKTHWLSTFKVFPNVPLSPTYLMDDPVPFIAIDNTAGNRRLEIYNGGLPPLWDRLTGKFKDDWGHP